MLSPYDEGHPLHNPFSLDIEADEWGLRLNPAEVLRPHIATITARLAEYGWEFDPAKLTYCAGRLLVPSPGLRKVRLLYDVDGSLS